MSLENMLVNMAVADAYGAGFEFRDEAFIAENNDLKTYYPHKKDAICAQFTDDTQMTIALMNAMIAGETTQLGYANHFVEQFKKDPRLGYAERFQKFMESINTGQELLDYIRPFSNKNGSVMRCVPLSLMKSEEKALIHAKRQAMVTHTTEEAVEATEFTVLVGYYMFQKKMSFKDAHAKAKSRHWNSDLFRTDKCSVACNAVSTVCAVMTILSEKKKMSEILHEAISWGGDTDSVAAVAIGLASLSGEFEEDLPQVLFDNLEPDSPFGLEYLNQVNQDFLEALFD